jgi:hypothetical protein
LEKELNDAAASAEDLRDSREDTNAVVFTMDEAAFGDTDPGGPWESPDTPKGTGDCAPSGNKSKGEVPWTLENCLNNIRE